MGVYNLIYSGSADTFNTAVADTVYLNARASTDSTAANVGSTTGLCRNTFASPNYTQCQVFCVFDTSAVPAGTGTGTFNFFCGSITNTNADTLRVREVSSVANKIAGASLSALTLHSNPGAFPSTNNTYFPMAVASVSAIPRSATFRVVVHTAGQESTTAPTGANTTNIPLSEGGAGLLPYLLLTVGTAWEFLGISNVVEVTTTAHALVTTGIAGTLATGDLLVACFSSRIASTTSMTLPTGGEWTLVSEQKNNNALTTSSALPSGMMAYCVRGASNPNLTFTHPTAPSVALGRLVAYRNVKSTSPLDASTSFTTAVAQTAVSGTGLTTTQADDLIVALAAGGQEAAWSGFSATTDPTGVSGATVTTAPTTAWLERADSLTTTGNDTSLAVFDAVKASAGATGSLNVTASVSAGHVVVAGAFKIAAAAGTNYTDTITASALDIVGQSITGVYVGSIAYTDTIAASSVPIVGSTIAPVYTANYADTLTPSSVPIGGATLAADVFASSDTITAGAVPIVGTALADVYARSDTLTLSSVPITGAALTDVLAFADTIAAGALPIAGQTISPVYTANYTDTLTAGALPLVGQAITPVFSAGSINYTDTVTPGALPIGGSAVTPVYTANYSDTLTAGAVPIGGQTITAVYTARYSDTLTASGVPLVGQAITAIYTANYSDTLTAGNVPVVGATIAPVYTARYSDTLVASSLPIVGSTITPVYTARYTDTLTASSLPITGQAITPVFSAGAINYTEVIAASALPIGGATLVPAYVAHYTDTIAPGSLPIGGLAVAPVYTAHYADTLVAGSIPLVGQAIAPVFSVGALPTGDTFVNVGGVWKPAITYVKDAGAWKAPVTYVKHSGIWTQL